jgi:hypothetical protein
MEREYNPALLGFIIIVEPALLPLVKQELIKAVTKMESDEMAFIYRPGANRVPTKQGAAVSQVANYNFKPQKGWRLSEAIEHTVMVMSEEDEDAERRIFIIFNKPVPMMEYEIKRGVKSDQSYDFAGQGICKFYLCNLGDPVDLSSGCAAHPDCTYHPVATSDLGQFVLQQFKKTDSPFGIKVALLDMGQIQKDYQGLKENHDD